MQFLTQVKIGSSDQLKASDSIKQAGQEIPGEDHFKFMWMSSLNMVKGEDHVLLGNKNAIPYHTYTIYM